jgi:hypothetical protein
LERAPAGVHDGRDISYQAPASDSRSLGQLCVDLLRRFGLASVSIPSHTAELVKDAASQFRYSGLSYIKNVPSEELFTIFESLPAPLREAYLKTPDSNKQALSYLQSIGKAFEGHEEGLLKDFHQHLLNEAWSAVQFQSEPGSFKRWLVEGYENFRKLSSAERAQARASLSRRLYTEQVSRNFDASYYAKISIENGVLKIGSHEYRQFKLTREGGVRIKVPRSQVVVGADNPLETAKMQALLANPLARPKSVYEVNLGLNGAFYIVDGNHRFALLDKRNEIWVELGSMKSMNIREFLIRTGNSEPGYELRRAIFERKADPLEALPDNGTRESVLWSTDQLVRAPALPLFEP